MRWIGPVLCIATLFGCATAPVGMTIAEFNTVCASSSPQGAVEHSLSTGEVVMICPTTGTRADPLFVLFEEGKVKRRLPETEVIAMLEHDRCLLVSESEYADCRVAFVERRAQLAEGAATRRQRAAWPTGQDADYF